MLTDIQALRINLAQMWIHNGYVHLGNEGQPKTRYRKGRWRFLGA